MRNKFCWVWLVFMVTAFNVNSQTYYCTKTVIQDSLEISLYSPTMFRFRISHLREDKFPGQYEIPFVIGKVDAWTPIAFKRLDDGDYYQIQTDSLTIRIAKRGLGWTVYNRKNNKKIYPSSGPVYGMFRDGYTVFDNVSAFDAPSKINRYSHWFYNTKTKTYTDIYLEDDLIDDKYFIYGPSYANLFAQMNQLIGPEPLLPKKGYGFFQTQHLSCEGTQSQLMEVVKTFREKKIPLDNIILDFEWGDGCDDEKEVTWGSRLHWNKEYSSPLSPQAMVDRLKAMHVDLMLVHHSAGEFKNRKHQGWTETTYPEEVWWNEYQKKLDMGIRGTWQDTRLNDITDSYIYKRTQDHYGTSKRVQFLGCRKVTAFNPWDFRFSVMPTENMMGARRYPFHWTEDCSFSWNEMAFQLKAINNTWGPMSGYSYLASDVMGSNWKIQARWSQFTALSAIARSHNSKPWSGNIDLVDFTSKIRITGRDSVEVKPQKEVEQTETAEASIRKYLSLRYRLLPYIYSYAHVNYKTGMPITRPMLLAFPNDYMCSSDTWPYQYMLGEYILVAPVYGDFNSMEIYLPKGFDWIDYHTGDEYKDGGIITYNTQDINILPIFIKKGAIIPMRQEAEWINTGVVDDITFDIYPHTKLSYFDWMEDDGETMEYQNGKVSITKIETHRSNESVNIILGSVIGEFKGITDQRTYQVQVHGFSSMPKEVLVNGKSVRQSSDITIGEHWQFVEKERLVIIKLKKGQHQTINLHIK